MFSSAIQRLNQRRSGAGESGVDAGFTLIELMVVLLILAILLAIAIPTFLGVTGGANDRAAQSNINTALTTVKAAATNNNQAYGGGNTPITPTLLSNNEPSIQWFNGPAANQGNVSWFVSADNEGVVLVSPSKNGPTCWYAVDNLQTIAAGAGGAYGATQVLAGSAAAAPSKAGTFYTSAPEVGGSCDATVIPANAVTPWKGSF